MDLLICITNSATALCTLEPVFLQNLEQRSVVFTFPDTGDKPCPIDHKPGKYNLLEGLVIGKGVKLSLGVRTLDDSKDYSGHLRVEFASLTTRLYSGLGLIETVSFTIQGGGPGAPSVSAVVPNQQQKLPPPVRRPPLTVVSQRQVTRRPSNYLVAFDIRRARMPA